MLDEHGEPAASMGRPGPAPPAVSRGPPSSSARCSSFGPYAKEAFTVEVLAAAVLIAAAALCLVGSVPDARPGSTPAGTAT